MDSFITIENTSKSKDVSKCCYLSYSEMLVTVLSIGI